MTIKKSNIELMFQTDINKLINNQYYNVKWLLWKNFNKIIIKINEKIKGFKIFLVGRFSRWDKAIFLWKTFDAVNLDSRLSIINYFHCSIILQYSKCIKNLNLSKLKKIKKIEKFQKDNRKKHVETMFIANKQKNYVKIIFQKEIIDASIINFMIKYEWMSTKPFKYFYLLRKND